MNMTIQRQRLAFAHARVVGIATTASAAEFRSRAIGLPVMLMSCGLGQSLAMLQADSKAVALAAVLEDWLSQCQYCCNLHEIVEAGQDAYLIAQAEAMQMASALKLMASALIAPAPAASASQAQPLPATPESGAEAGAEAGGEE